MNIILVLVKNCLISSKKDFLPLVFYFFSFPILLHLFLVTPLNTLFENVISDSSITFRPTYLYRSFASIVYVSCAFTAFFISLLLKIRMKKNQENSEYILSTGVSNIVYDCSIILWALICAFIQYIISTILVLSLSKIHVTSYEISLFIILTFIICIFFSILGLFISNFIKTGFMVNIVSIFLIIFLCFGSGTFVPLNFYHHSYVQFSDYNIFHFLYNAYIIVFNEIEISFRIVFSTIFFSSLIFILHHFYNYKYLRNYIK